MQKIDIRGVGFANVDMREALEFAKQNIAAGNLCVIHTPNAEITQDCVDDESGRFYEIINSADMVIPDGAGVVLASRILNTPLKEKVAGIELAYHIIDYLDERGGVLFLLGARPEVVEKAAENLRAKHNNIRVFYNDGFFDRDSPAENRRVIDKINDAGAEAVFVCLGALGLKQEKWIFDNKAKINKGVLIGLGGTIDNISGLSNKRAPRILIKLNLEWLYRLAKNPARIKRLKQLPRFILGTYLHKNKN